MQEEYLGRVSVGSGALMIADRIVDRDEEWDEVEAATVVMQMMPDGSEAVCIRLPKGEYPVVASYDVAGELVEIKIDLRD